MYVLFLYSSLIGELGVVLGVFGSYKVGALVNVG